MINYSKKAMRNPHGFSHKLPLIQLLFDPDAVRTYLYFAKFEQVPYGSLELILAHLHLIADESRMISGATLSLKGRMPPFAFILAMMRSMSRSI